MNGIEKITQRIIEDAQNEAKSILDKAEAEAAALLAQFETQATRESEEILRRGFERAQEREKNLAGTAQMEARKDTLAAKQKMLDAAFTLAETKLKSLPQAEYITLLGSLAAQSSFSGEEAIILSPADHGAIGEAVLQAANEALSQAGKKAALTLSPETRETGGGLLLQDGKIETNCTFETLLRLCRGDVSGEVAATLFP